MKRIISFISIFVLLINLFAFPIPVKADGVPVPGYSELKEMQQDIENGDNRTVQDIWHVLQPIGQAVGVIMNPIQTIEFIRDIVDPVAQTLPDYPNNGSDTDKSNYITNYLVNNTTTNDSSKNYTMNQNAKNLVNGVINQYISRTGFVYVYSNNINNFANSFATADLYNECKSQLNSYKGTNKLVVFYRIQAEGLCEMYVFPANSGLVFNSEQTNNYRVQPYNKNSWNWAGYEKWEFNTSTKKFDKNYRSYNAGQYTHPFYVSKLSTGSLYNTYDDTLFSVDGVDAYKMFMTLDDLKSESVGQAPYYINNSVNTTFKNSSGDYTVTTDNSNHATYGDVQTYIDNHHDENNEYPTPTQIEIYIEQVPAPTPTPTPTPGPTTTPDNPSGGTVSGNTNNGGSASASATANNSGVNVTVNNNHNINFNVPGLSGNGIGSGTVSGNGNGSGGIFDWISDIGSVIGDFIKNVGQLIADVIKGITETITTVLADIPNIISFLVEFVYGGLPEELQAIVTLGITTVIFVGVIKMMRK